MPGVLCWRTTDGRESSPEEPRAGPLRRQRRAGKTSPQGPAPRAASGLAEGDTAIRPTVRNVGKPAAEFRRIPPCLPGRVWDESPDRIRPLTCRRCRRSGPAQPRSSQGQQPSPDGQTPGDRCHSAGGTEGSAGRPMGGAQPRPERDRSRWLTLRQIATPAGPHRPSVQGGARPGECT